MVGPSKIKVSGYHFSEYYFFQAIEQVKIKKSSPDVLFTRQQGLRFVSAIEYRADIEIILTTLRSSRRSSVCS